jgi:hypothetical protein
MRMTSTVIEILKEVDPELSEHLTFILDLCHADLTPVVVAWNTYFFAREFPSSALSVLWDAYLLDEGDGGFALLHPYVCCALIEALRVEVLKLPRKVRSFEKLLALLKDPPVGHWPLDRFESLIKRAQNMRRHHPEFVAKFADQLKAQIHHHEEEKSTVATCSDSFIAFALASLATIQSNDEHQRFVAESLRRFPEIDVNTIHRFSQAVRKDLRDGRTVSFEAAKHIFRKIAAFY